MSWTSKWRIRVVRREASRTTAKASIEDVVQRRPLGQSLLEFGGFGPELGVGEGLDAGFELIDGGDERLELLQVAFVLGAEDFA